MAIQFIDNQPIIFDSQLDTYSLCKADNSIQCAYYTANDTIYAQWKQTSCTGTNDLCNSLFDNTNANLISNGTFNTGTTGWTLAGGAAYDSVNDRVEINGGSLTQSGLGIAGGNICYISFDYGGATAGTALTIQLGGTSVATLTSGGSYTAVVTAGGVNTAFVATGTWDGWIDNIVVKFHGADDWYIRYSPVNMLFNAGTATHIAGTGNILYNGPAYNCNTVVGAYYKFKLKVTGLTQGSIFINDQIITAGVTYNDPTSYLLEITQDGVYEVYSSVNSFMGISIFFSDASNGTISDLELIQYGNYYNVILKNTVNLITYNLTSSLDYYEDWITLKYPLTGKSAGCYELIITDACGYVLDQSITTDPTFSQPLGASNWDYVYVFGNVASATNTGGKFVITAGGTSGYLQWRLKDDVMNSYTPPSPINSATFTWSMTTGVVDKAFLVQLSIPGAVQFYTLAQNVQSNTTYGGTVTVQFASGSWSSSYYELNFVTASVVNGNKIEISDFELKLQSYYPGQSEEHTSECITITTEDDCLKWVAGINGEDSYGFHFDPADATAFQLGARVKSMLINPKYSGELRRYEDAEGNIVVTKGKSGKVYTLFIDYTDEHSHDWLRLATLCDTIDIDGKYYVGTEGDYEPEWPDNLGNWNYAQARVEVQKKIDVLYNNNAG